jgi:hypothetical protein
VRLVGGSGGAARAHGWEIARVSDDDDNTTAIASFDILQSHEPIQCAP